jgi:transcriptional antiterminator RfaH
MQQYYSSTSAEAWIVINTQPHRERLTMESLRERNFDAYYPLIRKRRSHARRIETVLRPLFPNYLFVRVSLERAQWRPILSTHGVRTIVRMGQELSYVEDAFINSLKAREVDGAIVRPEAPYQVGQKVQIAAGPFDGIVATIIAMNEKDRLVVLLDLMQRSVKMTLTCDQVTAV